MEGEEVEENSLENAGVGVIWFVLFFFQKILLRFPLC